MTAESVSQEEATEEDDSHNGAKAEKTKPMGTEWSAHVMKIKMSTFSSRWGHIAISSKDGTGGAGVLSFTQ